MRFTTLKQARLERDILQVDLAQRAGIDRARLSLLENAHSTPRRDELERIAAALNVPIERLTAPANDTQTDVVREARQ